MAIDTCLKIFFVFNLKFPEASAAVWQFVQFYFYDISLKNETAFPSVKVLINELTN